MQPGISLQNLNRSLQALKKESLDMAAHIDSILEYADKVESGLAAKAAPSTPAVQEAVNEEALYTLCLDRINQITFSQRFNWRNHSEVACVVTEISKKLDKPVKEVENEIESRAIKAGLRFLKSPKSP